MTVRAPLVRLRLAAALGASVVLLAACGASGKSLIPASKASSLQADFDKVLADVQQNNCSSVQPDLHQAETDLSALPSSVNGGLRHRLAQGLSDLSQKAPRQCQQSSSSSSSSTSSSPSSSSSTSTSTSTSSSTSSTPSSSSSTPASSSSASSSTASSTAANPGGGAQAPGVGGAGQGGGVGANGQ